MIYRKTHNHASAQNVSQMQKQISAPLSPSLHAWMSSGRDTNMFPAQWSDGAVTWVFARGMEGEVNLSDYSVFCGD